MSIIIFFFDMVVYLLDGEAEITIGGQPKTGATDAMRIIPANIAYALLRCY